ncbi:MAG: hypothetical protein IAG10_13880 [Planctomycetaceae bacterium]|nr:hypothetical protein [Planctomycetaceae bacterium]
MKSITQCLTTLRQLHESTRDIVATSDVVSALVLVGLLNWLGSLAVAGSPKLKQWTRRLALGFLLAYAAEAIVRDSPSDTTDLLAITIRSCLAGGLAQGLACLFLPAISFLWQNTLGALIRFIKHVFQTIAQRYSDLERRLGDVEVRRREAQLATQSAPSREREAATRVNAQKRREDARAECDALFALAAPVIGTRFSKQDYTEFVSKYMANTAPPEVVEERAEQLKAIIRQHQERVEPLPSRKSLQELSAWFEERMSELQSVPDERLRKTLIVQLKVRYSDLTSNMLSEMSP